MIKSGTEDRGRYCLVMLIRGCLVVFGGCNNDALGGFPCPMGQLFLNYNYFWKIETNYDQCPPPPLEAVAFPCAFVCIEDPHFCSQALGSVLGVMRYTHVATVHLNHLLWKPKVPSKMTTSDFLGGGGGVTHWLTQQTLALIFGTRVRVGCFTAVSRGD